MKKLPTRVRIAFGLIMLVVSAVWMAISLGLVPSDRTAILKGRGALCETIGVNASAFIARNDLLALDAVLRSVCQRNSDVLSAGVRKDSGELVIEVGPHAANWKPEAKTSQADAQVFVPIWANDQKWGTVEMRFTPPQKGGRLWMLYSPYAKMTGFITVACALSFLLYLRRMLQNLDPSKVVPPHVRAALDTLAEGLLILDESGRIALANRAFAETVGKTPDQLMGQRASKLPWEQNIEQQAGEQTDDSFPWSQAISTNTPLRNFTLHLPDGGGVRRTFMVNCSPIAGPRNTARGALASFEDITVLVQKELELRKSKEAADIANRAKSNFLAQMSHEIRTPMNAILGFADILRRGYEESESERKEYLNTIHSSGQHLLELINDILDLSKIESGKLEIEAARCSPHQILSEVGAVLGVRAEEKGIALSLAWDGKAPETILTDPTRFRQIVTNLVGNAIKFTEKGGVRMIARFDQNNRRPRLIVDVADSGIGMTPESLKKIFNPFTQADNSITRRFGGTGLGLSISRQCATALGGELKVRSEYGKGSVFTLSIDAGPAEAITLVDPSQLTRSSVARASSADSRVQLKPARILVVEDGLSNQKLIAVVLGRAGVKVELANNGKIGFEMALASPFDVILMDMQMPVMDGFTATRLLREKGMQTPIIALTANAMKGEEEKCRAAGCSGYLSKPIDVDELIETLGQLVGVATRISAAPRLPQLIGVPQPAQPARELAALKSSLPMDDSEFVEIVQEFVDRLKQQMGLMKTAWQQKRFDQLAALAHWLKGSGGTAGFHAFTAPAAKLEQLAKAKRVSEIEAALADVDDLARRVVRPVGAVSSAAESRGVAA